MTEAKTTITDRRAEDFIASVEPPAKRADALVLDAMFRRVTGAQPRMCGPSMIGYGDYRTTYASGRDVHWMRAGFSPRKARHTHYLMGGYCDDIMAADRTGALARLGKHTVGKGCLYINKLADIDLAAQEDIIVVDWQTMQRLFPES